MLKSLKNFLIELLNYILPPRNDFSIVKNLDENRINNLPKATNVAEMDWIHPLFQYKHNTVRAVIWELKYKENTLPIGYIGKLLYEEIMVLISDIILFDNDAQFLLIPIPITNESRAERGFNQSEIIAKAIIENDIERVLLYAPQWLEKTKDTPKQSLSQSRQERISNLIGCFRADSRVEEKYIILIDDVVTTGSTLSEAKAALLSSGAKEVMALTIAH